MIRWLLAAFVLMAAVPASAAEEGSKKAPEGDESAKGASDQGMPKLQAPPDAPAPFRISIGTLASTRAMRLTGDDDRIAHKPPPYFGGRLAVSGTLSTFESLQAMLRFDSDIGYGVSKSTGAPLSGNRQVVTEMMFGGLRVWMLRQLVDRVHAGLGAGAHVSSVILQPNPVYTGHRYLAGETGLRVRWRVLPGLVTAASELAIYPVFSTSNSNGVHGPGRAFGGRASAEFTYRLAPEASDAGLRGFRLVLDYRYQRFRTQFPKSPLGPRGGRSVDNHHVAGLLIEYAVPQTDQ